MMVALAQTMTRLQQPMDGGAGTVPLPAVAFVDAGPSSARAGDKMAVWWSASEDGNTMSKLDFSPHVPSH